MSLPSSPYRSSGRVALLSIVSWVAFALFPACTSQDLGGNEQDNDNEETIQTAAGKCGVERWSVKTGTDADIGKVNLVPVATTIAALSTPTEPKTLPANNRIAPEEWRRSR